MNDYPLQLRNQCRKVFFGIEIETCFHLFGANENKDVLGQFYECLQKKSEGIDSTLLQWKNYGYDNWVIEPDLSVQCNKRMNKNYLIYDLPTKLQQHISDLDLETTIKNILSKLKIITINPGSNKDINITFSMDLSYLSKGNYTLKDVEFSDISTKNIITYNLDGTLEGKQIIITTIETNNFNGFNNILFNLLLPQLSDVKIPALIFLGKIDTEEKLGIIYGIDSWDMTLTRYIEREKDLNKIKDVIKKVFKNLKDLQDKFLFIHGTLIPNNIVLYNYEPYFIHFEKSIADLKRYDMSLAIITCLTWVDITKISFEFDPLIFTSYLYSHFEEKLGPILGDLFELYEKESTITISYISDIIEKKGVSQYTYDIPYSGRFKIEEIIKLI